MFLAHEESSYKNLLLSEVRFFLVVHGLKTLKLWCQRAKIFFNYFIRPAHVEFQRVRAVFSYKSVAYKPNRTFLISYVFYSLWGAKCCYYNQRLRQVLSSLQFTIREPRCENIGSGKRGEPETVPLLTADGHISVVTR